VSAPETGARRKKKADPSRSLPKWLNELLRSKMTAAAVLIVMAVVFTALFAPLLAPHDPTGMNIVERLKPPFWMEGGSGEYLLGTDALGRDILSRIIFGARVSLIVGFGAVVLSGFVGVLLGLIAGYLGGIFDDVIMRIADIQLALPFILLAIAIVAVVGPGLVNIIIVLAIGGWVRYARVVRGQVLAVRELEYVEAARALGETSPSIMLRQVLPNVFAPVIVVASFAVGQTILTESSLSFLGFGVEPSIPAWGGMLADGRDYLRDAWWLAAFPGMAITLTILGVNLFGDWLRDYLDPRLKD
jgi:peptide/nickel transport system permease protein